VAQRPGLRVQPLSRTECIVGDPESVITSEVCAELNGVRNVSTEGVASCRFPVPPGGISCPGGVAPTEDGECVTKPGQGNDPT
jgi:hypothetical protein